MSAILLLLWNRKLNKKEKYRVMKIETIKISELESFIDSTLYKNFADIPITRLRALSQAKNPRASQDDVALIFTHEDNELLSYIGLLPDTVWHGNEQQRVWWNSCWWANEKVKNNGSMHLFYLACKLTNGKLYFPELTPHTGELLNRMKNFTTLNVGGVRAYLKLNIADILPARKKAFVKVRPILLLIDWGINLIYSPFRWNWKKMLQKKDLDFKIIDRIDDEAAHFIGKNNTNELFRRNKEELNWIIDNPWITEGEAQPNQQYAFSLQAKSFKTVSVKIYENQQIIGFFILLLRNGDAKLTYCYFNENSIANFVDILYKVLLNNNVFTFLSFDSNVSKFIQNNKNPFIFTRKQVKTIAFPKDVELQPQAIQDGDGDCAFV